jgi:hypothetical protein
MYYDEQDESLIRTMTEIEIARSQPATTLFITTPKGETQTPAPAGFFDQTKAEQRAFLSEHFPGWDSCCDGRPNGNRVYKN